MANPYSDIFRIPGTLKFSLAAAIARFPMAVLGLSTMFSISALYSEYGMAGTANAIMVIGYAIANPFYARLVDRKGQSHILTPLLVINLVFLIGLLTSILLRLPPIWVYLCAGLTGVTSGSFGAYVRSRWSYVTANPAQLNTAFSWESAVDEVIYILGPILATFLITWIGCGAGLVFCALCALGAFWFLAQKSTEPPPLEKSSQVIKQSLFRSGAMVTLCTIFMFCGIAYGGLDLAVIAFCRENQAEQMAGMVLATMGVSSFIAAVLYGAKSWRLSPLRLFSGGILLLALSFSLLLWADTMPRMFIAMLLMGAVYAPTMTNANNLLQRIVPPGRFTEGLAWYTTAFTLGISLGAAVAGYVIDYQQSRGGLILVVIEGWLMLLIVVAGLLPLRNSLRRTAAPTETTTVVR